MVIFETIDYDRKDKLFVHIQEGTVNGQIARVYNDMDIEVPCDEIRIRFNKDETVIAVLSRTEIRKATVIDIKSDIPN